MNRKPLFLICALLAACAAASCGETVSPEQPSDGSVASAETPETEAVSDAANYDIPEPEIPEFDFGGAAFRFLDGYNSAMEESPERFLVSEGLTGEIVNDTVFNRNLKVEEKFHVDISMTSNHTDFINLILSGEPFDLVMMDGPPLASTALQGLYLNLTEIPYLNLTAEYWGTNALNGLILDDLLYFMPNEICLDPLSMAGFLYFNKRILNENDLENPYELVYSNQWTIDKYLSMVSAVPRDLNGDGIMDHSDLYGDVHRYEFRTAAFLQLFFGCGQTYTKLDEERGRVMAFDPVLCQELIDKIKGVLDDKTVCIGNFTNYNVEDIMEYRSLFMEGHTLFIQAEISAMESFRNMEDDFGLVPNPKYDSSQEAYYHRVHPHSAMFAVATTAEDLEKTGAVTEWMAWLSHCMVVPAYYEITIKQKRTRDVDAEAMLDLIRKTLVFEFGDEYDIWIPNYLWNTYVDGTWARMTASEKLLNKQIDRIVKKIRAVE